MRLEISTIGNQPVAAVEVLEEAWAIGAVTVTEIEGEEFLIVHRGSDEIFRDAVEEGLIDGTIVESLGLGHELVSISEDADGLRDFIASSEELFESDIEVRFQREEEAFVRADSGNVVDVQDADPDVHVNESVDHPALDSGGRGPLDRDSRSPLVVVLSVVVLLSGFSIVYASIKRPGSGR